MLYDVEYIGNPDLEIYKKVAAFVLMYDTQLKDKVYIEVFEEDLFREYFTLAKNKVYNHRTRTMEFINGLYRRDKELHKIAIVANDDWKRTIIHELIHAEQAEIVPIWLWLQLEDVYNAGNRKEDPYEFHAYWKTEIILKELETKVR